MTEREMVAELQASCDALREASALIDKQAKMITALMSQLEQAQTLLSESVRLADSFASKVGLCR